MKKKTFLSNVVNRCLADSTYYIVNKIECVREGEGATSPCGPCVVRSKMNKDQVPVEGRGLGRGQGHVQGTPSPWKYRQIRLKTLPSRYFVGGW